MSALGKLRQEDREFKTNLAYKFRQYFHKPTEDTKLHQATYLWIFSNSNKHQVACVLETCDISHITFNIQLCARMCGSQGSPSGVFLHRSAPCSLRILSEFDKWAPEFYMSPLLQPQPFIWVLEIKPCSSGLLGRYFSHWAISAVPRVLIIYTHISRQIYISK